MKKKIIASRHLFLAISFLFISMASFCQNNLKYNAKDVTALNALSDKWQKYWNIHNMDSMGTLLRDDVDFVNVGGNWLKGKAQVIQDHKIKHQSVKFKTSIWQTDSVAIKYVKSDLAIMHIAWRISGDFENDGTPRQPRHGIFIWVVSKQNNNWLLLAVQNTNFTLPISQAR